MKTTTIEQHFRSGREPELREYPRAGVEVEREIEESRAEIAIIDGKLVELRPRLEQAEARYNAALARIPSLYSTSQMRLIEDAEAMRRRADAAVVEVRLERTALNRRKRTLEQRIAACEIELRDRSRLDVREASEEDALERLVQQRGNPLSRALSSLVGGGA